MQKLVSSCPPLAAREEFRRIGNLRSIDCIATRLWFDRRVSTQFPANVLSGFEETTGATWFNLNDLQVSCHCTKDKHARNVLSGQAESHEFLLGMWWLCHIILTHIDFLQNAG